MYPSQTSLIPATVALLNYFDKNFINSFFTNYPYWYLGSTPYKYLIGPIMPLVAKGFKSFAPGLEYFEIVFILIYVSFLLGLVGWVILLRRLFAKQSELLTAKFYLSFIGLYLLTFWKYLSTIAINEATNTIAKNMIPFVIVAAWYYLRKRTRLSLILSSLVCALVFLINSKVLSIVGVGLMGLCLTVSYKNGKIRRPERRLKRLFMVLIGGLILSTLWYGVGFWWVQLTNPGIGGLSGVGVFFKIADFIKNLAPLVLAIIAINFSHKIKNRAQVFALTWLITFGILTLYRFLADPDYWMDWSSWLTEVEMGFILLAASSDRLRKALNILTIVLMSGVTFYVYSVLGSPTLINKSPPSITQSLNLLSASDKDKKIFLTGSNVFWANALTDVKQLRGGRDEVSKLPGFLKDTYILRESNKKEEILSVLKKLQITYVLINTDGSTDYYHDYKNLDIWRALGAVKGELNGDVLINLASD